MAKRLTPKQKLRMLEIDFKKWGKGWLLGIEGTSVFEIEKAKSEGTMCCLGFCALQLGYESDEIVGKSNPSCLEKHSRWPRWLLTNHSVYGLVDSTATEMLMNVNDAIELDSNPAVRMALIAKIFAKHGTTVKFTNVPKRVKERYDRYMTSTKSFQIAIKRTSYLLGEGADYDFLSYL